MPLTRKHPLSRHPGSAAVLPTLPSPPVRSICSFTLSVGRLLCQGSNCTRKVFFLPKSRAGLRLLILLLLGLQVVVLSHLTL